MTHVHNIKNRTVFQQLMRLRSSWGWLLLLVLSMPGCRTPARLAPVDLAQPGWKIEEGQAIWETEAGSEGIAGDLLVASHPSGASLIQFSKTPLPLVAARIEGDRWQIEFIPAKHIRGGRGVPPARILWLHLPTALRNGILPSPILFRRTNDSALELLNNVTKEKLTIYLAP